MIILLSPAKTLDFESSIPSLDYSTPEFITKSETIAAKMQKMKAGDLIKLMDISNELALLNAERYQYWRKATEPGEARQAIYTFKGDVYIGLRAETLSEDDMLFAQQHLRILSGLYGILKPKDLIMPHRLEMGTNLKVAQAKDLYAFWKESITSSVKNAVEQSKSGLILNLASAEYAKSVDFKTIGVPVIAPVFKDFKNGHYKIISFFAKKARGMMASFVVRNKIVDADQLKAFSQDGYNYNNVLSTEQKPVFTRG
jgi:uncharacterized protein